MENTASMLPCGDDMPQLGKAGTHLGTMEKPEDPPTLTAPHIFRIPNSNTFAPGPRTALSQFADHVNTGDGTLDLVDK